MENVIVYGIGLAAVAYVARRGYRSWTGKSGCGSAGGCAGCASGGCCPSAHKGEQK